MDNVPGFIKINEVDGFKSLKYRDGVEVKDDDYLYLRQNHYDRLNMISLGTLKEARQRSIKFKMPNHI